LTTRENALALTSECTLVEDSNDRTALGLCNTGSTEVKSSIVHLLTCNWKTDNKQVRITADGRRPTLQRDNSSSFGFGLGYRADMGGGTSGDLRDLTGDETTEEIDSETGREDLSDDETTEEVDSQTRSEGLKDKATEEIVHVRAEDNDGQGPVEEMV